MKCLSKWLAERWNKLALSRFSISCSFSKTCLTNINYLQLLAVEKGQGLLGFSICTINWFTDRNDAALERHNSLVRYVASLWLMFSSCPHVHVAVHVFKMFREKPLRGKGSSPLVFFCFVCFGYLFNNNNFFSCHVNKGFFYTFLPRRVPWILSSFSYSNLMFWRGNRFACHMKWTFDRVHASLLLFMAFQRV